MTYFMKTRTKQLVFSLTLFLTVILVQGIYAQKHPFLLTNPSEYNELARKASKHPWKYMRDAARDRFDKDFEKGKWQDMARQLSYSSIMFVTDQKNARRYKDEIISIINRWPSVQGLLSYKTGHTHTVDAASALVNSIIAMDLVYPLCSTQERQRAEQNLQNARNWFERSKEIPWRLSRSGVLVMWALYQKNNRDTQKYVKEYTNYLFEGSMMKDGSWNQSPGYVLARIAGSRISKNFVMDVLQHTGKFNFYGDKRMRSLMEWTGSFAFTPYGGISRFGDSGEIGTVAMQNFDLLFSMDKFGGRAGEIAKWFTTQHDAIGPRSFSHANFFTYVLMKDNNSKPVMPRTLLKDKSGAAFWERGNNKEALNGVLYSLKKENNVPGGFGHAHEDVNSISITGYGTNLISNAGTKYVGKNGKGFNYPGYTPDNKRWFNAWMQNTVTIGNQQTHKAKHGQGLIDGVSGGLVEFGRTGSGDALRNGKHYRYLFMMHPVNGKTNGYFALVDEVVPSNKNEEVKVNLHPNTVGNGLSVQKNKFRYAAKANAYRQPTNDGSEGIVFVYGSSPNRVNIKEAFKGDNKGSKKTKYLESVYRAGNDGTVRAATILFPYDKGHKAPGVMNQIKGTGYSGVYIDHGRSVEDRFFASTGPGKFRYGKVLINGRSVFYRTENKKITSWAVAAGYGFHSEQSPRIGFESKGVNSIQMDGKRGHINTQGGIIRFFYPKLSGVRYNGRGAKVTKRGKDWIDVELPRGKFRLDFDTNGTTTPTPTPPSGKALIANGTYTLTSPDGQQNLIAPIWAKHNAQMHKSGNFGDQKWEFRHLGNNVYSIRNVSTKRFLEVPNAKCTNGSNVATWTHANSSHMKWKIERGQGNTFTLRPSHCLARALDRKDGKTDANIHIWGYNKSNRNQQWQILPASRLGRKGELEVQKQMILSPNPARSIVTILLPDEAITPSTTVEFFTLSGQVVKKIRLDSGTLQVNVQDLSAGAYIVKATSIGGSYIKRLLIQ